MAPSFSSPCLPTQGAHADAITGDICYSLLYRRESMYHRPSTARVMEQYASADECASLQHFNPAYVVFGSTQIIAVMSAA
jgi:hypothetical protein